MTQAGITGPGRVELSLVLAGGRTFVTPLQASAALGVDGPTAARKLSRWAAEGWLRRVRRGLYIGVPVEAAAPDLWSKDPLVVAAQVWPCYFTGWTAANHWALSDQVFRTTVLKTTSRVRASSVELLGQEYMVSAVTESAMSWGMKNEWVTESRLKFADPARTVIDILDAPRLAGGMRHGAEILDTYLQEHAPATLIDYGDRIGNGAIFKRLGYCLEAQGHDFPDMVRACRERISTGVSALDPDGPKTGRIASRWNLKVNVTVSAEEPA